MVTIEAIIQWLVANYEIVSISTIIVLFTTLSIRYFRSKNDDPNSLFFILLAICFGVISVIPSLLLSFGMLIVIPEQYAAIIVAPIAEEIGKAIFVGFMVRINLIKDPMDGFVYGAMVGTGFAAVENFLYAYTTFLESGLASGLFLASFRSAFIVLGHPLYTGLTGFGMGKFVIGENNYKYGTIWQAILMHALWNGSSVLFPDIWLFVFIGVIIFSFVILKIQINRARNN